jgi:hypothetical protein
MRYLQECRRKLRGFVPARAIKARGLEPPKRETFARFTFEAEIVRCQPWSRFCECSVACLRTVQIG